MKTSNHLPSDEDQFYQSITQLPTIRILFDYAGGVGNEASSLNVMSRLRAMGFEGTFEVLYPEIGIEKFPKLFGIPSTVPAYYAYDDQQYKKIILISYSEHVRRLNRNEVALVDLALTGAYDSNWIPECKSKHLDCFDKHNNFAKFVHAKAFFKTDSFYRNSKTAPTYAYDEIYLIDRYGVQSFIDAKGKFFILPKPTLQQAVNYLENDPSGQTFAKQTPAINTFIAGVKNKNFNVLPIYGSTIHKHHSPGLFPKNILQVIASAGYAQLHGNDAMQNKPLIIPIFYDYKEELLTLEKLIQKDNWQDYEFLEKLGVRKILQDLILPNKFFTVALADTHASEMINNLNAGDILILSMGSIPNKNLFDALYMMDDENVWPQIREGQSSLNGLLKKIHLRCSQRSEWELGSDYVSDPEIKNNLTAIYHSKTGFCAQDVWLHNPDIYKIVGQFYIDSQNPNSWVFSYFKEIAYFTSLPENDRIANGLRTASKFLTERAQAPNQYNYENRALVIRDANQFRYGYRASPLENIKQSIFQLPTFTFNKACFDYNVEFDKYTQKPIFTFRLFNNQQEIGSISYYGEPLCFSKDGLQNNIIQTSGILKNFTIQYDPKQNAICDALPPTVNDKAIFYAKKFATYGALQGGADLIRLSLYASGMPKNKAAYLSNFIYYSCFFSMRIHSHLSQTEDTMDPQTTLNAFYNAALETGELWLCRTLLQSFTNECNRAVRQLAQQNKRFLSGMVNKFKNLVKFGVFAASIAEIGVVESSTALAVGMATEACVKKIERHL